MIRWMKLIFALAVSVLIMALTAHHSSAGPNAGPTALTITAPSGSGVVLPELDEFATTVLGDPWDMNESTDLAYFYPDPSNLVNSNFAGGIYSAQMTAGDGRERITLLSAGAPSHTAMRVGKIGYNFPINANHYHYLTFRMYSSNTSCNSGGIQWFADDSYSFASMGLSSGFLVPPDPCLGQPAGWYIYVIDLKTIGLYQGGTNWSGLIRELILHPFAGQNAAGATLKLDWVRLTAEDPRTARPYTIRWTGDGSGGPITLYASPSDKVLDPNDIVIASNQSASGGSFVFQTGVLPAGAYYIAAENASGVVWSSGPLIINSPPQVSITKPSATSGQEYSASEIGNAWDMSDRSDLNYRLKSWEKTCVTNEVFANGIYSALVPPCPEGASYSESILYLGGMDRYPPGTPDPTIDTTKYRYLSYRFYESGINFSASRFGWWQADGMDTSVIEQPVMSRDIVILDGWNTYTIDLWANDVVDETYPPGTPDWRHSHPNRLRFDPNELLAGMLPVNIGLDWIKLTAMDEVNRGGIFPIQYDLTANGPVSLTFYYDTDTLPDNGRTLIGTTVRPASQPTLLPAHSYSIVQASAASPAQAYQVFLPITLNNACSGDCYVWNTAAVAPGTYYICINIQDAYNQTYRCSDAPLVVK